MPIAIECAGGAGAAAGLPAANRSAMPREDRTMHGKCRTHPEVGLAGIKGHRVEYRRPVGVGPEIRALFFKDQAGGTEGPLASGVGMGYE